MGASIVHQDNQVTLAVMTAQANFSLSFIAFEPSKKRGAVSIVCLRNVADREASTQHSLHRPCPHFIGRVSSVNHGGRICRPILFESTLMLQIYCDGPYNWIVFGEKFRSCISSNIRLRSGDIKGSLLKRD